MPPDIHYWNCSAHLCCSVCRSVHWYCPNCGAPQGRRLSDPLPAVFPITNEFECSECGVLGTLTLLGWKAAEVLQQAFDLPAAQPPVKSQQSSNSRDERLTVNKWRAVSKSLQRRLTGFSAPQIRKAHEELGGPTTFGIGASSHRTHSRSELIAALGFLEQEANG